MGFVRCLVTQGMAEKDRTFFSNYCRARKIPPEKQCGLCSARSTVDKRLVVHPLKELGLARNVSQYMYFIEPQKTYDSVDRQLVWVVLARLGGTETELTSAPLLHESRALGCVRVTVST